MALIRRSGLVLIGFLASATATADSARPAKLETVYRGEHQNIADPTCILAVGHDGQPFLLRAEDGEFNRAGDFNRIEPQSKLQLSSIGPELGESDILVSGDERYVVGTDGAGNAFEAPRRSLELPTCADQWKVLEWSKAGTWKPSDVLERPATLTALAGRNGTIWAVGCRRSEDRRGDQWVVRRRSGAANAWKEVDAQPGYATAVAVAPDGVIYVAGVVGETWTVRRSPDGEKWTTVDRFKRESSSYPSVPQAIAADGQGRVHVAGYIVIDDISDQGIDEFDVSHWLVRSSTDGGAHFRTTDEFRPKKVGEGKADGVAFLPSGDAVVVGTAGVPLQRYVRLLRSGEKRWTTIGAPARAVREQRHAIAARPDGTVYVVGAVPGKKQQECAVERFTLPSR